MKKLLFNVPMIVCIFSVMNVMEGFGQDCTQCQSGCSGGASANGDCSFAAVEGATADGLYSAAIGYKNAARGPYSLVFGNVIETTEGSERNMTIGMGIINTSTMLTNSFSNSIMLGMNSTLPTMFIEGGAGSGTWGNVGIGTTAPIGMLHLRDEAGESNELVLEKYDNTLARLRFQQGTSFLGHLTMDDAEDMLMTNRSNNRNIIFGINQSSTQVEAMRIVGSTANVGIGTAAPGARLHVRAAPAGNEQFLHLTVNDAALPENENYLRILNYTATADELGFMVEARNGNSTTVPALTLNGVLDQSVDVGSTAPVMTFNVRKVNTSGSIANRPLFSWHNDGTAKMRMNAAGNLGIGTASPAEKLHVAGKVRVNTLNPGGTGPVGFDGNGNLTDFGSSIRFKDNVSELEFDRVAFLSMQPVSFNWKSIYGGFEDVGFIAQQVAEVFPDLADIRFKHDISDEGVILRDTLGLPVVDSTQTEPYGVKYHKIPVYLYMLAKQQDSVIQAMAERLDAMQTMLDDCCTRPSLRMDDSGAAPDTDETSKSAAHAEFVLLQNDPNPFADYTDIRLSLPQSAKNASLLVVDMKGTVMLNVPLNGGPETIRVYSSDIGKGIFTYYLLNGGNVVASRKMVSTK
ncbi:MAG: tail fiber domain-containing protein [Flavobacteriales bacterium]|nr:tail fiber domain-containing protein [Flavobacteriales bacterium]